MTKPPIRNPATGRMTRAGRAAIIERAKALLVEAGWTVTDAGIPPEIVVQVQREFELVRRETARAIVAQSQRLLRGEVVEAWRNGTGRPRQWAKVQVEQARAAGLIE